VTLRSKHKEGERWYGVDVLNNRLHDMMSLNVIDPVAVKKQVIKSAVEAASLVLKIDDIIAASKLSEKEGKKKEEEEEEKGGTSKFD
jgi:chaperonin GroEL (HSP60 family)